LIENKGIHCARSWIEKAVWNEQIVNPATVNRYIAALRIKISQVKGRMDIADNVLVTTVGGEYVWKVDIPVKVLRNG
jgi:DNA-binding winged helix-turn-helix (wHTH) protein